MDLYLKYLNHSKGLNISNKWVKGHQDGRKPWEMLHDLLQYDCGLIVKSNMLCDKRATEAQTPDTFTLGLDVLPSEKWALYSNQPVTGNIEWAFRDAIHYETLSQYTLKNTPRWGRHL
jgi:hypothetical protein